MSTPNALAQECWLLDVVLHTIGKTARRARCLRRSLATTRSCERAVYNVCTGVTRAEARVLQIAAVEAPRRVVLTAERRFLMYARYD